MPIFNRLKRLFRADIHAILDLVEEPEAVLKQAIREMEELLDQKRSQLARIEKTIEGLRAGAAQLEKELNAVGEDLELCLREGSEELARKTIGRKLALKKKQTVLEQRLEELEKVREELTREVDFQQDQVESIQEKAQIFSQAEPEDSPFVLAEAIIRKADAPGARSEPQVTDEEVELEWMRVRGRQGPKEES